ncbi:hypothetical protein CASFOL_020359 [Castilleja foliolosa]|uniref:F-box domain-containing protein n=1 Tax=Castilleja foliolosa TaxID=1961234 RepID=A0ABD3D247_9LAMI
MKIRRTGDRKNRNRAIGTGNEVSNISTLPVSLLLEIFLRLGIEALIYCKSVCKSWYKLLSESSFSDFYEKYSGTTHLMLPKPLLRCKIDYEPVYLLEFDKNWDCSVRLINLRLPKTVHTSSLVDVVNSCNGLFTLLFDELVYISNPITGVCIELPKHRKELIEMDEVLYKIGFSPSENKFKVVRHAYHTLNDNVINKLSILTVGVDKKWRRVTLPCRNGWFSCKWICLDGAFHWIVKDNNGTSWISTFDLAEEKFGRVSHPPDVELDSEKVRLELYGNRLTLMDSSNELHIDLWTMSDTKTWSKDEILYSWFPSDLHPDEIFLIGMLRNGVVLFSDSTSIIHIDVKGKRCSRIRVIHSPRISYRIMMYTPRFSSFWKDVMPSARVMSMFRRTSSELLF